MNFFSGDLELLRILTGKWSEDLEAKSSGTI